MEITEYPDMLYDPAIPVTEMKLLGRRLYEYATLLDIDAIVDTSLEPLPIGYDGQQSSLQKNGKYQRFLLCKEQIAREFPLEERIALIFAKGGWLHCQDGYKYRIKEKRIVEIGIHGGVLHVFQDLSKPEIAKRFGRPDFVKEEMCSYDQLPLQTTFVYARGLRIAYWNPDRRISLINLGESLVFPKHSTRLIID